MKQAVFVRLALRRLMRKNPAKRDELRTILRDPDLLEALAVELTACAATELGEVGEGSFLDFFKYLIENADLIFEIIAKLLIIFAESE